MSYLKEKLFLFWDKIRDSPVILGDDGEFYIYEEIPMGPEKPEEYSLEFWWSRPNKLMNRTPLMAENYIASGEHRYDVFDMKINNWITLEKANRHLIMAMHKHVGNKDYKKVLTMDDHMNCCSWMDLDA